MPTRVPLRHFKPLKIDFYLIGEVFTPFLGGILFFLFIFLMFQALRLAEFFIVHGIALGILGKLTFLMLMSFLPTALPIAFLIAVLVAFGRLSADSELVALKANGFSLFRLATPIFALAVLVVGFSIALNLDWVPWSQRTFKQTLIRVGNTKVVSSIREGTFTSGFFDLLIFADKVDSKSNRLHHVFLYDETDPKNPRTVIAKNGEVITVKTQQNLGSAAVLNLFDGSIHHPSSTENSYEKLNFGDYKQFLKIEEGGDSFVNKPEFLSLHDLLGKIHGSKPATYEGEEWRGELWRRITIAVSPFLFVFLGIGFGTVRTRAVRAGAALVAMITLVLYYGLLIAATVSFQRGLLPAWISMQIPNLGLLFGAIYGFKKASW